VAGLQGAITQSDSFPPSFAGAWKCVTVVVDSAVDTVAVGQRVESKVRFMAQPDGRVLAKWQQPGWTEASEQITRVSDREAALDRTNYFFHANGLEADGLASVRVLPRRKDRTLVDGTILLTVATGDLVRLTGRLAKNPSFWVKNVDIARSYARLAGVVVPVSLTSTAEVRLLGAATLRMSYVYSEIDGRRLP